MNTKRAGALISLALAVSMSPIVLAGPANAATTCGTPAIAAVYETVVHPAQPAVLEESHEELGITESDTVGPWEGSGNEGELTGQTTFHEAVTVTEHYWSHTTPGTPATTEDSGWVLSAPSGQGWVLDEQRTVIDQAYVPAVPGTPEEGHYETVIVTPAVTVTEYQFVHAQTGQTRWNADRNWNANGIPNSNGYTLTGVTRETVTTPAVTEERWVVDEPATEGTPEIPEVSHTEYRYERTLAGTDAVVAYQWSVENPGTGWADTGQTREIVTENAHTEYEWARTVIDVAAKDAVPATTEEVLVAPAVPAGPPCPVQQPVVVPVTAPAADPVTAPVVKVPAKPAVKPAAKPAAAKPAIKPAAATPAAASAVPTALAHTGAETAPIASIGALLLMAGAALSALARRAGRKA